MQGKDYSEYTLTEAQKYQLRRQGNRAVLLDYFSNSASFDSERRTFRIQVDDGKEDDWMDSFIDEDTEATAQRLGKELQTLDEDDDEETRQEEWAQNQTDAALFAKRYYNSSRTAHHPEKEGAVNYGLQKRIVEKAQRMEGKNRNVRPR